MASSRSTSVARRAILIRNAYAFDFGGAERFVVNLAEELKHLGWEAIVVSRHDGIEQYATRQNVPFIRGPWLSWQNWTGWRTILFPLYVLWQLRLVVWYSNVLRQYSPSVIHPQSRDDFIAATIAGKMHGCRVIWTDHADLKYVYQNVGVWYKNPVGKWVRRVSRKAQAITVVSKSERSLIASSLGSPLPANYQVVYNGSRDTKPKPTVRGAKDRDALIFCATSRLVTAKGIGELIKAFQQLEQAHQNIRLWLVGDGPEIKNFKTLADNDPNIQFFGFSNDVVNTLAAADIFVHPSYHEGFSLSIVEAAMLGKAIIACDVGGNGEIVHNQKSGLLVAPKDVETLHAAMELLTTDKALRQKLGQGAREAFEQHFQFDTIVKEQFLKLYEQS